MPWEISVYLQTGRVIPISTGGIASIRDGLTYAVDLKGYRQESYVPKDSLEVIQETLSRKEAGELETFSQLGAFIIEQIQKSPIAMAKLLGIKFLRSWFATDSGRYEIAIAFAQGIYLSIAARGMWISWKQGGMLKRFSIH